MTPDDAPGPPGSERPQPGIPDHVPAAQPDHLSLGQTVSEGLGQALPGFLKTAASMVPLILGGTALTFVAAALFLVVMFALAGGFTWLMGSQTLGSGPLSPRAALALLGGYLFVVVAASYGFIVVIAAIISPFYVAMLRSHWRSLQDDSSLGVLDGIRGGFRLDLLLGATVLLSAQSIGFTLLLVPGILVDAATNLTLPGMVIDELGFWRALGRSVRHFLRAPIWHIGLAFIDFVLSAALNSFLPFVGFAVAVSLQIHLTLHAYRDAFPVPDVPSRHPDGAGAEPG